MRRVLLSVSIFLILIAQLCADEIKQMVHGGVVRTYIIKVPSSIPDSSKLPLVLRLHGNGGSAYNSMNSSFSDKAEMFNFIAVYADGINNTWNNLRPDTGVDDIGFISALIDTLIANYPVDTTRIYSMGFSKGGTMSYYIAEELSHKINSIGPIAVASYREGCNPGHVPIVHIVGTADKYYSTYIPVLKKWRIINNCDPVPDTLFNSNGILGERWNSKNGDGDIILYTIQGLGHKFPTEDNSGMYASDVILDFFNLREYSIPTTTRVELKEPGSFYSLNQNYPNPFNSSKVIKYRLYKPNNVIVKIFNISGQEIETLVSGQQTEGKYEITWQPKGLPGGIYYFRLQAGEFSEIKKLILHK